MGIDDVFAILYTFFRNDIQLVGIVADYGNVSRENAIKNINYLKSLVLHKYCRNFQSDFPPCLEPKR